jgi:hypothetical protein
MECGLLRYNPTSDGTMIAMTESVQDGFTQEGKVDENGVVTERIPCSDPRSDGIQRRGTVVTQWIRAGMPVGDPAEGRTASD